MATTKKPTGSNTGQADAKTSASNIFSIPSFSDLTQLIQGLKLPNFDVQALAEWQRKDMEALVEANREAFEGIKALAEKRNEILRDTLAQWQEALTLPATGKDALRERTEATKGGVDQAIANFKELSTIESEARKKAWAVVQDRMQENMVNLQKLLKLGNSRPDQSA